MGQQQRILCRNSYLDNAICKPSKMKHRNSLNVENGPKKYNQLDFLTEKASFILVSQDSHICFEIFSHHRFFKFSEKKLIINNLF